MCSSTHKRLNEIGCEEIDEIRPYQAYAIVSSKEFNLKQIESDPEIVSAYFEDPPCAK